jgi:tetratricopeptide (TPR) repeat protein
MAMPVSKKTAPKAAAKAKAKAPAGQVPDRQAMAAYVAAVPTRRRDDALTRAQNVMYDAWEKATSRGRVAGAHRALAISPLCADAFNLLAGEATTARKARDLYALGLHAGELALGSEGFEEYEGEFWGFLETRPYMRARHGLATTLLETGEEAAAVEHFRAMLKLNPNDNQGIRYLLLASLLQHDDTHALETLLAAYPDDGSPYWSYTHALLAYRQGQAAAAATQELLKAARAANEHVPAILAGTMPPVVSGTGYITMGGPDEATDYVRQCGAAWRKTPGAIEWLAGAMEAAGPARRRAAKPGR